MSKVIVIGGGPAGMMAARAAADNGHEVTLYERNEKLGKKLYITGKGRCNLTNACEVEDLFPNIMRNSRFLYSAFYSMTNEQLMDFFREHGLSLKVERGNRVFPVSDHSSDVINAMRRALEEKKVHIRYGARVKELLTSEGQIRGILTEKGEKVSADAVILATGGLSYQSTGSDGDGLKFAGKLGHKIISCRPSLVPLETKEEFVPKLQGLSLRNVSVKIFDQGKKVYDEFGEMLFTHFGVSGPLVLSASSILNDRISERNLQMEIDLKPALSEKQLDDRLLRDFEENKNKQVKNSLGKLLPAKMIPVMIEVTGLDPDKKINEVTREERCNLLLHIKKFTVTLTGTREFNEAIITRGGVDVKEVNSSTMESKLVKGLYFAGEILDLDALTGGFNLQIAWSTGYLAGSSISV